MAEFAEVISSIQDLASNFKDAPEDYQSAIAQAKDGIDLVKAVIDSLHAGKPEEAVLAADKLTRWSDVNQTALQSAKMRALNEAGDDTLDEVLSAVTKVLEVVVPLGIKLAPIVIAAVA